MSPIEIVQPDIAANPLKYMSEKVMLECTQLVLASRGAEQLTFEAGAAFAWFNDGPAMLPYRLACAETDRDPVVTRLRMASAAGLKTDGPQRYLVVPAPARRKWQKRA